MKLFSLSLLISLLLPLTAQEEIAPDPYTVLANARYVTTLTKNDLSGKLKKGGHEVPVQLYMRGKDIQMQYQPGKGQDWKGIHLQLNDDKCDLFNVQGQKSTKFADSKIGQDISGTDLSYEDLSLRFLYWPDPEIVGQEKIKLQDCYIVEVYNPDLNQGNYAVCRLWIHKKAAALMKVKAFDKKGKHVKTFEVSDLMKVKGDYVMEKMKVERIKDDRVTSISYLIFDNPDGKSKKKTGRPKLR